MVRERKLSNLAESNDDLERALKVAASNNDFDSKYHEIVETFLSEYLDGLRASNRDAGDDTEKALLEDSFNHIITIKGEA